MSPDTHWAIQFAGGFILASAAWFVWLSVVVANHQKEDTEKDAAIFDLTEEVKDLRQQKSPVFQIRDGSVDPVVRRNPPDPRPLRQSTRPPGELLVMPDIDDIPPLPFQRVADE